MGNVRMYAMGLVAIGFAHTLTGGPLEAQRISDQRRKLNDSERSTTGWLIRKVDEVTEGALPGGDAWLKLQPHFLRAPDGDTYVPFTLLIDEAPSGFETVALYLRAMEYTGPVDEDGSALGGSRMVDLTGAPPGAAPINMAETNHNFPNEPVASENSARAASIEAELSQPRLVRPAFEDVHFMDSVPPGHGAPALVRSAMSLEPGDYDIYVAVGESADNDEQATRSAVIVRRLRVPDLSGTELTTSSVIVVDRVDAIAGPLSADEQVKRPYAFGAAEVTPRVDASFRPSDRLAVLLFAYNLATLGGLPEATVEYRFFQGGVQEQLFVTAEPQRFGIETLPADFDLAAAGNQLPINADVPLAAFPPGPYRLEIAITDEIAGRTVSRNLPFRVDED
jgi:hypothetical protein